MGRPNTGPAEAGSELDGFRPSFQPDAFVTDDEHHRKLRNTYMLGHAVEKLRAGLANLEDVKALCLALSEELESEITEHCKALLQLDNLDSDMARELHFQARVCGGMMTMLNRLVESGRKAGEDLMRENEDGN